LLKKAYSTCLLEIKWPRRFEKQRKHQKNYDTALLLLPSASFFKELAGELTLPMVHAFLHLFASLFYFENDFFIRQKTGSFRTMWLLGRENQERCKGPVIHLKTH